ncbi:MAG: carboxylesterase/lipase family protein [Caulobacteraceae bacterium]|nr:carboxylesterase/lipase family protein [Caulobacteraceae bacterium]
MDASRIAPNRRDFLRLGSALALAGLARPALALAPPTGVVATTTGPVRGYLDRGISTFKGLRYAAPPVGPFRFRPPQPLTPWTEPVSAVAYGHPAVQMYARPSGEPSSALGKSLLGVWPTAQESREGNEDCLVLNVWTPALDTKVKRPVMVWVHGGGYAYGSGAWPTFDGGNLARKGGVVVVTVNHRLNAFGFSALEGLFGQDYDSSANAGLVDLVAALEWVRDNAAAFGGDAANVTLFGQSGGGAKVCALLAMPAAKGLAHKAIVQSGPGLKAADREGAVRTAEALIAELGVARGDAAALQAIPAAAIFQANYAVQARAASEGFHFTQAPIIDAQTLPRDPFTPDAPAQAGDIPLLVGTNKDEAALFMASQPWHGSLTDAQLSQMAAAVAGPKAEPLLAALRRARPDYSPTYLMTALATATGFTRDTLILAERKAAQSAPVYMYRMDWETPIGGGVYKAGHSLETALMFDNVETCRALVGPGPDPQTVADQMSAAWIAFAHTGNPNAAGLPDWPRYDASARPTMIFDVESRLVNDPDPEVRKALQS